ncbi:MAG: UDP-N-acetylmuramate--L-alanine ligase [Caldilineaceae bacterium]
MRPQADSSWQQRLIDRDGSLRLHLMGIGGAGLSAIARVLLEMGFAVSGSDRQLGVHTERLVAAGAFVLAGQQAENLTALAAQQPNRRPDVVLISSAINDQNSELQAYRAAGIPVVKRDDFLAVLTANRKLIAVAGTHGKSTTTSMIVRVLKDAGIDIGYIIGAQLSGYGNAAAGTSPYFVLEADEYDHMFLGLNPIAAVITNVEWDHPDCYPTPERFHAAFAQFVEKVDPQGLIVSCADDAGAEQLRLERPLSDRRWITYGLTLAADIAALNASAVGGAHLSADLYWWNAPKGQIKLQVPGLHNMRNALAALAIACYCDAPLERAVESLEAFTGAARRFEQLGEAQGIVVIDDYAHNPTKVRATLAAARSRYPQRRIWAVVQPHTFSRTQSLLQPLADSFRDADQVIVTDIYAAREVDEGTVHATQVVAASAHPAIQHIGKIDDVVNYLVEATTAGDLVVVMGAGDSSRVGRELLERIAA